MDLSCYATPKSLAEDALTREDCPGAARTALVLKMEEVAYHDPQTRVELEHKYHELFPRPGADAPCASGKMRIGRQRCAR